MPDQNSASSQPAKATEEQHAWVERTLGVDPQQLAATTMRGVVPDRYGDLFDRQKALFERLRQAPKQDYDHLRRLYREASDSLNGHDPDKARELFDRLVVKLDESDYAAQHPVVAPPPKPRPDAAKLAMAATARDAWKTMLAEVEDQLDQVETSFMTAFRGHPQEGALQMGFHDRVNRLKYAIDFRLGIAFDDAAKAADDDEYGRRIEEARGILKAQSDLAANDATIPALDANPFRPTALHKLLTTAVAALADAVK